VLTVTGLSMGNDDFRPFPHTESTLDRLREIVTADYVRKPDSCAKFGANLSKGGFWANW